MKEMASELGVAEITVRRDVEKLEQEGKLKRVQGGAVSLEESAELTMRRKISIYVREKEIVARHAASLVEDGDTVFLDGGTTIVPLAKILLKRHVNIVTYNTMLLFTQCEPRGKRFPCGWGVPSLLWHECRPDSAGPATAKHFRLRRSGFGPAGRLRRSGRGFSQRASTVNQLEIYGTKGTATIEGQIKIGEGDGLKVYIDDENLKVRGWMYPMPQELPHQ